MQHDPHKLEEQDENQAPGVESPAHRARIAQHIRDTHAAWQRQSQAEAWRGVAIFCLVALAVIGGIVWLLVRAR